MEQALIGVGSWAELHDPARPDLKSAGDQNSEQHTVPSQNVPVAGGGSDNVNPLGRWIQENQSAPWNSEAPRY